MSSMYQPITSQEETNINIGYGESIYSFDGEVDIVWKGQDYNFQSAADFMTAIDFSSNSLSGGVDKFRRPSFPKYVKELSMWCYPGTHWQSQTFRIPRPLLEPTCRSYSFEHVRLIVSSFTKSLKQQFIRRDTYRKSAKNS
jgi:hypothetical protein